MALNFGRLREAQEQIWRAELGALLHNVGKMHPEWTKGPFRYDLIGGSLPRFLDPEAMVRWTQANGGVYTFYPNLESRAGASIEKMEAYGNLRAVFAQSIELPAPFDDRKDYLIGDLLDFQDARWYKGPDGDNPTWFQVLTNQPSSELTDLFQKCHEQASGGEKRSLERELGETESGEPDRGDGNPRSPKQWQAATVFGFETPVTDASHEAALALTDRFLAESARLHRRDAIRGALRHALECGLADPRPPVNDVRVSDMGFAASAFFKAAIAAGILEGKVPSHPRWRLVRICLDGDAYLEQANRISDLAARNSALTALFEAIRQRLEVETPLGNEIYRDTQGAVYLLPALTTPVLDSELLHHAGRLIQTQADTDKGAGQELAISIETSDAFALGPGSAYSFALGELLDRPVPTMRASPAVAVQWRQARLEVCSVCGIRPIPGKGPLHTRRICESCHQARAGRCREWRREASEPGDTHVSASTIWVDELADRYGRAALVSARFRLGGWLTADNYIGRTLMLQDEPFLPRMKSPSFARLARVFETTRAFWAEALREFPPQPRERRPLLTGSLAEGAQPTENVAYMLEYAPDLKVSVVYLGRAADGHRFVIAENQDRLRSQIREGDLKTLLLRQSVLVEPTGYGSLDRLMGEFRPHACESWGAPYRPELAVCDDPGRMWLFGPAETALDRAAGIYDLYTRQMAAVRDRLALDIGIAYFPAATPVRVAIDAARRFTRSRFTPATWTVAQPSAAALAFINGVAWEGLSSNPFYANFETAAGPLCRLPDLRAGDSIRAEPSHFDFLFLEPAAARFELTYGAAPTADGHFQRRGGGLRPHPLDRLADFKTAWALLSRLTTSQIEMLDEQVHVTPELWPRGRDETYRWFALAALARLQWPRGNAPTAAELEKLADWARNGVLEDTIEIRLGIEKRGGREEDLSTSGGAIPEAATKESRT